MQILNFTLVKLTLFLIIGIVLGYLLNIHFNTILPLTGLVLMGFFFSFITAKKKFKKTIWFGALTYSLVILIGILVTHYHNEIHFSNHYTKHLSSNSTPTITFRIREVLKPGHYYDKYIVDILEVNDIKCLGKSLLKIEKDSLSPILNVDAIFITKTEFKSLKQPLNPHQFDYENYLKKKYIYHQLVTTNETVLRISSKTHTLFGFASKIRHYVNLKLAPYNFKPNEIAVINALLQGQRQDISKEVYKSYSNAGALHILAVSGLHVSIILLILSIVLKPLKHFKHGKILKTILIVLFLWGFAVITGLSASVTRAVAMFSILTIGLNLRKPTNIYNTIAISMFIILLVKPLYLFDVGFQLSYLAVFSIIAIDPIIYKYWKTKNYFLDKLWHTLTITLSAQFAIIPLSLYYFHQFPSLFFISNLVIIPFLGFILSFGVLIIFLALLNVLPQFVANIYGSIISFMNNFMKWVSNQDFFLLKDISFNLICLVTSYFIIITIGKLLKKRSYSNLKWFLLSLIVFQFALILTNYSKPKNEFIIFHKNRYSLIGNTVNNKIIVAHDFDSITESKNNIIRNYAVGNHIKVALRDSLKSIYLLNNKILLVIDSLATYNVKTFSPDYILLRQSPKVNLSRIIDSIKPKYIIADGSNYKYFTEKWKAICIEKKLPFHQTSEKGAFKIKY